MRTSLILLTAGLFVALLAGAAYWLSRDEPSVEATLTVAEAMSGDTTGFARVQAVRAFSFPEDHGPHPAYKLEWWYYTGNLATAAGRRFGYQFTIFRFALRPPGAAAPERASAWAADQFYMAHLTLSDVAGERFHAFERFSRGAAGLAGARTEPFRVWVEDWAVEGTGAERPVLRIRAAEGDVALDLTLRAAKPPVLQGDRGYDRKGPNPGDASYYYSLTRLATEGTVTVGDEAFAVAGLSWMDREWSTSALGEEQVGWDWFSLHLSDGRDLMYYQIRERGGRVSPFSDGVLVGPDGTARPIARDEVVLEVLDRWRSPSGATYPSGWRLRIPAADLSLRIEPYLRNQELDVSVRYWEGAVRIEGTAGGAPVTGSGYVELTGYDDAAQEGGRSGGREAPAE